MYSAGILVNGQQYSNICCPHCLKSTEHITLGRKTVHVIVLGAGVIGVTTAYYLARAGAQVTVVDRHEGAALDTSFANAGQVSPGYSTPWGAPGIPLKALKWMFQRHAPLSIRPDGTLFQLQWLAAMLALLAGTGLAPTCSAVTGEFDPLRVAAYEEACGEAPGVEPSRRRAYCRTRGRRSRRPVSRARPRSSLPPPARQGAGGGAGAAGGGRRQGVHRSGGEGGGGICARHRRQPGPGLRLDGLCRGGARSWRMVR